MKNTDKNTQVPQSLKTAVMCSFFKNCYRIVDDNHAGFEVQVKKWFWPFYVQKKKYGCINTFSSIERAKDWIKEGCPKEIELKYGKVVYWQNCT
jgi:hypothetical protein